MALSALLLVGLAVAVFVGFNIGGSNIGVAFGPAVGAGSVSKTGAAALMTVSFFAGSWTLGRGVVKTIGDRIVPGDLFTVETSVAVLFFIGLALFLANLVGVPASTSMTGVGSVAGFGLASGALDLATMGEILIWWLVSPIVAFWVSGVIGRYYYPRLVRLIAVDETDGTLLDLDRSGTIPTPVLGPGTTRREVLGTLAVVLVACYTAFSAGASNAANAIAPLVGSGTVDMEPGLLLVGVAVAVGAFTIGRRTMDTMGDDLTELPLVAALVVAVVSSTLVTVLSWLEIPVSVVIIATMSIVGLGWGRATRVTTVADATEDDAAAISVDALTADDAPTVGDASAVDEASAVGDASAVADDEDDASEQPAPIEEADEAVPAAADLFEPGTTAKVIALQNLVPGIATLAAYLVFRYLPIG